jgi:type IV secretion system protein VirD4
MSQQSRRHDPYPWTWEIPLGVVLVILMVLVCGVHLGRGIANVLAGAGWAFPARIELLRSLPAVLVGDAAAGLDGLSGSISSLSAVWMWVVATEVMLLAVAVFVLKLVLDRWGPGRLRGMASRGEAERLLGVTRLRKVRAVFGRTSTERAETGVKMIFKPAEVGWRLGRAYEPRGGGLWVPWDRTTGVIGPQGSGKTLDLLAPALLQAPGAALVTLTKVDDVLLSFAARSGDDRPCMVLDRFGLAAGLPELLWDPLAGCVDSMVAERRAKAFTAGIVKGAVAGGVGDDAACFCAAEAAKVIQAFFHAAALTGRTLDHVLRWVANPAIATDPTEILREHPHAAPYWHGLLHGALRGDDRTAGNTTTTLQQAMSLFFQDDIRRRCVPGRGRPPPIWLI